MALVWEDPPTNGNRQGSRPSPVWAELKSRPGEWARTPFVASGISRLRLKHPEFEMVERAVDGKRVLYARYVGEAD